MLSIAPKPGDGSTQGSGGAASAQPAASATVDNRTASRRHASSLPAITGLRISPHGVEATLVNISETGLLAECGERLKPGSSVTVVFEGSFTPRTMEGRVARNSVSSMGTDGRLRYHVGISFAKPIQLPPDETAPPPPAEAPAPPPAAPAPSEAPAPAVPLPLLAAVARALESEAAASTPTVAPAAASAPAPPAAAADSDSWATVALPPPAKNRW
jgi:hypothetical protein